MSRLEELRKKEQQLKNRIRLEQNRLNAASRKRRDGKLISWGIVIEAMLKDPDESLNAEQWAATCKRFLSGRTLERALVDELEGFKAEEQAQPEPVQV